MRVLVLYERSGVVREAFRAKGHEAWSCDIVAASDGSEWHIQVNIDNAIRGRRFDDFDLAIAHPECTHLSVSGALRFKEKIADGRQQQAINAFMRITELNIPKLCIENPISIMSTRWRKPDQIVQPYQFGHDASKKTCLWLRGLPKLTIDPTKYVAPRMIDGKPRWANQTDGGQNRLGPSEHRAMDRARTYEGIAAAMAERWSA